MSGELWGQRCSLCGSALEGAQSAIAFPPFIEEAEHPLRAWSGSSMHQACLIDWPRGASFMAEFARYLNRLALAESAMGEAMAEDRRQARR